MLGGTECLHARTHLYGLTLHAACLPLCLCLTSTFRHLHPAGLSIMCGAVGYLGSLAFVRRIFRNVKVD
jgi:hypothetical protein